MRERAVVVLGGGVGGLAAAIDLANAGLPVTLLERADAPGGKMRELPVGEVRIDSGPTVLTMRWVFDELFADAGARLDERVGLTRSEVLARHAWPDGSTLDLFADPARAKDAIGAFAGPAAAHGFEAFRRRAREVYELLEDSFIRSPRPTPLGLLKSAGGVGKLLRIKPFDTLWQELRGFFADPRLRQLFGRYATYCGSSPFLAPATLMLVTHVELEGVYRVTGGMQRLPEAMATLAEEKGVVLRYGATAEEILVEGGRLTGVQLTSGERVSASTVIVNADSAALAAGLLGKAVQGAVPKVAAAARSFSALTLSAHAQASGFPLSRHNVFFSGDYEAEFADLAARRLPREPTVYVCAQDRDDDGDGERDGPERLFMILNAPAAGDREPSSQVEIERCVRDGVDLMRRCGLELEMTPERTRLTSPADFERRFPGTGGALYGRATHGATATFQRPAGKTRIPGLYLAGGSVHPGPGVPMATLSGRLAAKSVLSDLALTGRSRVAGTRGGTSTR